MTIEEAQEEVRKLAKLPESLRSHQFPQAMIALEAALAEVRADHKLQIETLGESLAEETAKRDKVIDSCAALVDRAEAAESRAESLSSALEFEKSQRRGAEDRLAEVERERAELEVSRFNERQATAILDGKHENLKLDFAAQSRLLDKAREKLGQVFAHPMKRGFGEYHYAITDECAASIRDLLAQLPVTPAPERCPNEGTPNPCDCPAPVEEKKS